MCVQEGSSRSFGAPVLGLMPSSLATAPEVPGPPLQGGLLPFVEQQTFTAAGKIDTRGNDGKHQPKQT